MSTQDYMSLRQLIRETYPLPSEDRQALYRTLNRMFRMDHWKGDGEREPRDESD